MKILDKKKLFVYTYFTKCIQYLLLVTKENLFLIEGNLSTELFSDIIINLVILMPNEEQQYRQILFPGFVHMTNIISIISIQIRIPKKLLKKRKKKGENKFNSTGEKNLTGPTLFLISQQNPTTHPTIFSRFPDRFTIYETYPTISVPISRRSVSLERYSPKNQL